MKRRFRQKQDLLPPDDPDKEKASSGDKPVDNVDIDDVIEEIDTLLKPVEDDAKRKK
jgi:hypothetical protein